MITLYYRYEIEKDNKRVGLLTELSSLNTESHALKEILDYFDKYLPVPMFYYTNGKNKKKGAYAWFSEFGLEKFKKQLDIAIEFAKEQGYSVILREQPPVGTKRLIYEDRCQAIIREKNN